MDEITQEAIDYLVKKYRPHTLILYGSRVRGDITPNSDIDVACFCDEVTETKEAKVFQGVYLDAWIYPTSYMQSITNEALRFDEAILLLDSQGYGATYLVNVKERLKQGPEKLSPLDSDHLIQWLYKMLQRVQVNDPCGNYRKAWLQFELLEAYFRLRGLWFLGDKKSFAYLKQNDEKAFQLFTAAYNDLQDNNQLKQLVSYVTQS
jgi:hypothetical protein